MDYSKQLNIPNFRGVYMIHTWCVYDLQKTNVEKFRVEKVLDWKTENGKKYRLVKWIDYDESYNSWDLLE